MCPRPLSMVLTPGHDTSADRSNTKKRRESNLSRRFHIFLRRRAEKIELLPVVWTENFCLTKEGKRIMMYTPHPGVVYNSLFRGQVNHDGKAEI